MLPDKVDTSNYLPLNVTPHGDTMKLSDGTEFYFSGKNASKYGVIILPDFYGWNSGRIRNICDFFGDHHYLAIIPRFGNTGYEAKSFQESSGLMDWIKSLTFDGNLKPTVHAIVDYMKQQGIEKIVLLGFSWGGWLAANLLASSDISQEFTCAALPHPSLDYEHTLYGHSLPELMYKISRPILILPGSASDFTHFKAYIKLLKQRMPTCDIINYEQAGKDFLLHGNFNNPVIEHACSRSLLEIYQFFNENLKLDVADLYKASSPTQEKTMLGQLQELAMNASELAMTAGEVLKEELIEGTRYIGERVEHEQAAEMEVPI